MIGRRKTYHSWSRGSAPGEVEDACRNERAAQTLPEPHFDGLLLQLLGCPEADDRIVVPDITTCETGTPEMRHVTEIVLSRLVQPYAESMGHVDERLA
jgi:hypothetical protein